MPTDLQKRMEEERERTAALDSTLHSQHTPYLKKRLRFAGHMLDDAGDGLRHAAKAKTDRDLAMWLEFAAFSIQMAQKMRENVQAAVDKYGGPEHIIEMGG